MKTARSTGELSGAKYALTFGNFDGIHKGHRQLLTRLVKTARSLGAKSLLISFDRHTRKVQLLNSSAEREKILSEIGIDTNLILNFKNIRPQEWDVFLKKLTSDVEIRALIASDKMRIGHLRRGTPGKISKWFKLNHPQTKVEFLPSLKIGGRAVSSTRVRDLIQKGQVEKAANLCGRNYSLEGKVLRGKKLGRTLGFPTMNMQLPADKIIPKEGVYAARVICRAKVYKAMVFIGRAWPDNRMTAEGNVFGFKGENYGESVTFEFIRFIRKARKMKSKEDLIRMLTSDKKAAMRFLKS